MYHLFNKNAVIGKPSLVVPMPEQCRFSEPDSDENIIYEEYTSEDGMPAVRCATVLKLVEQLTHHREINSHFTITFLIGFRSFMSPSELLELLIERFNIPLPLQLQQEQSILKTEKGMLRFMEEVFVNQLNFRSYAYEQLFYKAQISVCHQIHAVLTVLMEWIKKHWYDFAEDPVLRINTQKFLQQLVETSDKFTDEDKAFCKNILDTIDMQLKEGLEHRSDQLPQYSIEPAQSEILWHTAKKGDMSNYDLLTLHPVEIARQLTLLHFDLYRAIEPIELVDAAWAKHDKHVRSPYVLKLAEHTNMLTYWISRSIVDCDSLKERTAMLIRIMSVFVELQNFTGFVAFRTALQSPSVHRLHHCWQKLSKVVIKKYDKMESICDSRWTALKTILQNCNPPCIPYFGQYLTNIHFLQNAHKTFPHFPNDSSDSFQTASTPKCNDKTLVSFVKCRRIAEVIREIQMYQRQPYNFQKEPSIRHFFENINPTLEFDNDKDKLEDYLYERSLKVEPKKDDDRKPLDLKPKYPPHVLTSPGIKLRKPEQASNFNCLTFLKQK